MSTSPVIVWTKLLGTSSDDYATALTTGIDGSIYVGGITFGSLDGNTNSGANDPFLTKYNADGTKAWTKLLGGSGWEGASALTTGLDGSIYVSGQAYSNLDGQLNRGDGDIFLTKFTADGTKAWTKLLGTVGQDYASALTTGQDGSIYVSGRTTGALDGQTYSGGSYDAFLTKYSTDGTKAWTKLLGTSGTDYATALTTGLDGSIYVSGTTYGGLDGQTNRGSGETFLAKYSADGTKIWTKLLGTSGDDSPYALTTGLDGSIYVCGATTGALDGQTYSGGSYDAFLTKYSADGTKVWTKLLGTSGEEQATALTTGLDGSIYVGGYTNGVLDGQAKTGDMDVFLTKYSADGTKVWTKLLGTSGTDASTALTTGLDGSIYLSGWTMGALGGQTYSGSQDAFLTKYQEVAATSTYELSAGSSSYNEGSTATFTLRTTNVTSGTSVPYTLSGISASDVSGGSLSGNAVVNSSGIATISVTLLSDSLTEGSETLTVSAGGASTSTVVNDTSVSALVDDYPWSTGTNGILNTSGTTLNGNIEIYDDYDLFKVNLIAGSTYTIDLVSQTTAGLTDPFLLLYNPSVTFLLDDDNSGGGLNSRISLKAETSGTYYVGVRHATLTGTGGYKVSVKLESTPTYALAGTTPSVNEGSIASFTLTTTNVASGTSVPYTISGISAADVSGGSLSGNAVVNSSGVATISVSLLNDSLTEGSETLTVTAGGTTASTVINDTSKASVLPTYSVAATTSSFNEGSTATFVLNTTNVAAGTSVSYNLSGVSTTDLAFGSLNGTTTVASNGQATISVLLANDNLTEGTETLTVTAGGASASAQINDTSRSASPTYSISTNWTSTSEGTPIVVTLSTTNVSAGTTLYYQLSGSGITTSDFGGLSLTGSSVINSSGQASLTIPLSADVTTEDDETFVIQYYTDSGRSTSAGSAAYVTIQDTSKGAVTPTYAVSANTSSVNEGYTADFTITTSNVSAGTSIAYTLSGVTSSDITGGTLTGFATVNFSGTAFVSVPIAADNLTEGAETLSISLQDKTASILINDTSKAAAVPTYALAASSSTVSEGSVATFTLTTTGVTPGTSVSYTISGVSASDVTGGLSGVATIDTNGLATISVPVAADFLTEGAETLTVTAQGKTASVLVNDTSKTTLVASYALSASTNSVSEGSSAVFTLTTTNVVGGTSISYTISGVSSADITGGALSGTAIVSSSGNATITIPLALDLTTEGTESLTVTAQGISTSVLISDTSTTPVVVTPITSVTSIPYGDGKYFYGSAGSDKVTGTSFVDVVKQPSTVSSNQITKLSDGSWQVQNKFTPSNSDNLVNVERVEFSDMSVALDISGPAGQVAKILGSVFGKSYVSNTEFAGIGFAYLDGGMSYLDLCGLAAGAAGLSTPDLLVTTLLRNTTGTEPTALSKSSYLQSISSGASYASVVEQIADSSANAQSIKLTDIANTGLAFKPYVFPPTYSLSATSDSVNEGSTAVFNLTTTNVAVGTEVSYTLSGISSSDLMSGTLNGKVTIGAGGVASINVPIASDGATEGQESLTISAQGATASIVINDTSKGSAAPTYTLTPATLSVNEGELAQVYVSTTNVAAGTSLQFGISGVGITQGDVIEGLSRFVTVDSTGKAVININTVADQLTEGPETMYITLGTSTTSFIINDTSIVGIPPQDPVSY